MRFGLILGLLFAGLSAVSRAQTEIPIEHSVTVEQFFTDGNFVGNHKTRDRFTRLTGSISSGNWLAQASDWYYPFCGWYELDETFLQYKDSKLSVRAGRIRPPLAQCDWDDEWYSGLIFVPFLDLKAYGTRQVFERTSSGIGADYTMGPQSLSLSLLNSTYDSGKLIPGKLDRVAGKLTTYSDGLLLGISGMLDTTNHGADEQLVSGDVRWTIPQVTVRGVYLDYKNQTEKTHGFYLDTYFRPKGWSDVTLVSRFENYHMDQSGSVSTFELWTLGSKIRLPYDVTLLANYAFGANMGTVPLGGNWSFSLYKVFRF